MEFEILFYRDQKGKSPIEEFLLGLREKNKILVAKTRQTIQKIKNSAYHKEPLSKHIETGLWELRVRAGKDILRIFYTFQKGKVIILLHIFIKKQQKTPINELMLARKRLKEIQLQELN